MIGNYFFSSSGAAAYQIEQSLRFDGSSYLTHTHGSTPTGDNGTLSVWVKRRGTNYDYDTIIEGLGSGGRRAHYLRGVGSGTDGRLDMHQWFPDAGGVDGGQVPDAQLRDPSAWYHLLWQHQNSSTRSVSDRLWINGVEQTDITTPGNHNAQPWEVTRNSATATIGRYGGGYGYLQGYIAEMHCIDGSLVAADQFGEFDANGVWRPIEYTGTYGNNGFYLKFDPTATNGIGHDHSGNGNNFTASGFTTSGTGTDVMSDTPTTNWCTLNPLNTGAAYTLANGNLDFTSSTNWDGTTGTFAASSGKWYYEFTRGSGTSGLLGWCEPQNYDITTEPGDPANSSVWRYRDDGTKRNGEAGGQSYGATWTTAGDVIGCALDLDAGTIAFYKNGTSQGTAYSNLSGKTLVPVIGFYNCTAASSVNFGQRAFAYTPPTGFKALNTSNLPAPDIADGSQYFNTVLYTGDGASSKAITGVGFQPDWVWIKDRTASTSQMLFDLIRGAQYVLSSDSTYSELYRDTSLLSFDSDGFTVGNNSQVNLSSARNYVAWNWLAANGTSSNTAGTITSTVSASPTSGFSVVTYTGTGTAGTVGHGLGVAPAMYIVKNRDSTTAYWPVYHHQIHTTSAAETLHLKLDVDDSRATVDFWNNTAPTSTVFSVKTSDKVNKLDDDYVAYCFAEVEGYSKFGRHEGNGSSNGTFVYTGFKPAWIMTKDAENTGSWLIRDATRETYNPTYKMIPADNLNGEATSTGYYEIDILSNGFKIRVNNTSVNRSGSDFVYAAFAQHPFGGSGVSPATAR